MSLPKYALAILLLALPLADPFAAGPPPAGCSVGAAAAEDTGWIADPEDHICGLSSLRALSDPAKVDYPHLWDATPEIKKMKAEGIDPKSAEGIQLQQDATDRILKACKDVQEDEDHCSVWKKIRNKDGRTIPDITKKVEAEFPEETATALVG